jgi:hypothetical protein
MSKLDLTLLLGGLFLVTASVALLMVSWAGYSLDLHVERESTYFAGAGLLGFIATILGVSRSDIRRSA